MTREIIKLKPERHARQIREEIADLLQMTDDERTYLESVSMTHLITRLIDYCNTLEKALERRKIKLD